MKSKLYTRGGDRGTTSLTGGTRVAKDHPRLEAYGTLDELNSWLGLLAASPADLPAGQHDTLLRLQNLMFDLGAILATEPGSAWQPRVPGADELAWLETQIDTLDATLEPLRQFILPGGHPQAARAQIARTVARRAERRILTLAATLDSPLPDTVGAIVNRTSDYLFALARAINRHTATPEQPYRP